MGDVERVEGQGRGSCIVVVGGGVLAREVCMGFP